MIKKFFYGIMSGVIVTLFVGQYDPWVQHRVGVVIKNLYTRAFNCTVTGTVCKVNFFIPHIIFSDFSLSSTSTDTNHWAWHAQRYESGFSWISLLVHKTVNLWIAITNMTATSGLHDGIPSITPHIKKLMSIPDLPIKLVVKSVRIKNASLTIDNDVTHAAISWNCEIQKTPEKLRAWFHVKNGIISHQNCNLAHAYTGTIVFDTHIQGINPELHAAIDGQIDLPQLGNSQTCFITGTWQDTIGKLNIRSIDRALCLEPLILAKHGDALCYQLSAQLPISYVLAVLTGKEMIPIQGTCTIKAKGICDRSKYSECQVTCQDLHLPVVDGPVTVTCSLRQLHSIICGILDIQTEKKSSWHGVFRWKNQETLGACRFCNKNSINLDYFPWLHIEPHDMRISVDYNGSNKALVARYASTVHNTLTNSIISYSGNLKNTESDIFLGDGFCGSNRYTCAVSKNFPYLVSTHYYDQANTSLCSLKYCKEENSYNGAITMPFLRNLSSYLFHEPLHGEGIVYTISRIDNGTIHTSIHLADGAILMPQTCNLINGFDTNIELDIAKKRILFENLRCTLNNGSISSPQAIVWLDQSGMLNFVHVPLIVDHCLFSIKRDLFAIISGHILFSKKPHEESKLTGNIILDRSQLTENVFSQQEQKKLFQATGNLHPEHYIPHLHCDLLLETKDPIRIDTTFLQANAALDLHLHGYSTKPCLSGTINVLSGMIKFPYRPLYIKKGTISFFEDQPFNPLMELVAKNRIKNHNITLQVTGSVQNHVPLFESTPPLREEQIVNLLFTGAHEESLNAIIPTLLVKNIPSLILGSHKSDLFIKYLKPLMKQINVRLNPNFNNQTGEGSLRGTLEFILSDRWRALVEKNFNFAEDTHLELEYTLSDDVTFRMVRDEQCDLGGEVEMKWKF